jgi:hypothetical protein
MSRQAAQWTVVVEVGMKYWGVEVASNPISPGSGPRKSGTLEALWWDTTSVSCRSADTGQSFVAGERPQ